MTNKYYAFAVLILSQWSLYPCVGIGGETKLRSPDGRNSIVVRSGDLSDRSVTFEVLRDDVTLLGPSRLGCTFDNGSRLGTSVTSAETRFETIDRTFELPWGKTDRVVDHCNAAHVQFNEASSAESAGLRWDVEMRAYDDGVAFRYRLPQQKNLQSVAIRDEATSFDVVGDPEVLFNSLPSFTSSHESLYRQLPMSNIPVGELFDCPLLLQWTTGPAAAITEARVRDFAGCYLQRESQDLARLECRLSPHPTRPTLAVAGSTPLQSPWRVVLIGETAGELLESNLLLCLNDPPSQDDSATDHFDWVVPGKTSFHWWNGEFEHDFESPNGSDAFVQRHKRYIDFCAENGFAYHGLSGDGRSWYPQQSTSYGTPSADADVRIARPELRLPEILEYANQRGVGIRLWVHWKPLSQHLDEAFAIYQDWGVKGLMVDFLDRDDQPMIEFTERMLKSAAAHHLNIQIHGSSKFSGEQRTFPNLLNREGVLNLEFLKWSDQCDPQHNVNVAYTRALAGPVDYHHGGFRNVSRDNFKPRDLRPFVLGSRCHQLALYVVYENPLPMVADTPDAYRGQDGFEFLKQVPVTWDETRFVTGRTAEFVVVARRSGDRWYVGGINNWSAREIDFRLDFLDDNEWEMELLHDASLDGSQPTLVAHQNQQVGHATHIDLELASGGGFVATIRPKQSVR